MNPRPLTLITGASRGMGLAMARQLLAAGHELLCIARHADADLAARAKAAGIPLEQWQADLSDPEPLAARLRQWLSGIDPQTVRKAVGDILSMLRPDSSAPVPGKDRRRQRERDKVQRELKSLPQQELARLVQTLEAEMHEAAADLKFEYAARLRDEIAELRRELRDAE